MKKTKKKQKPRVKRFLVSVTIEDYHDEIIYARNEKEALKKFYEQGDGQFIDGMIAEESVRLARKYE